VTAQIIKLPARGAVPSALYKVIWQAIHARRRIVFNYEGHAREACPLILGYSAKWEEVVFAYQVGGGTSQRRRLPDWRCFHLGKASHLTTRDGEWLEGDSHRQTQSCVRHVDVDVNIPDTLTRDAPLPSGSPQLRPPRR
jgi:hypothetical protein